MNQNSFVTKNDLKGEFQCFEKKFDKKIEDAVGQIISAVAKGFEETATKEDLQQVQSDVKDIKRQISDLKADTVTDSQFKVHEKRIVKLENKVFA